MADSCSSADQGLSSVAVVRCEDYDEARVHEAIGRGLSLLGGADRFASEGDTLLLKPNLLSGKAPEKVVTTHPAVFKSVARHFMSLGITLTYGDSPGFGRPEAVARKAGLVAVAEELGIPFADFINGETVSFPEGKTIKQFVVARGARQCDGIVSLAKMKTHALTRMTGAVKNQFGCIPGFLKGEFHARLSDMDRFAQMLVDLTKLVNPRLYIMDGIVAMEGNGPGSGEPRPMNVLLFSTDPVALDAIASRMMNLKPEDVPTIRWGEKMGLGSYSRIDIVGDPVESFAAADFKLKHKKGSTTGSMNGTLARLMRNVLVPKPVIETDRCTRCGTCVKVCPSTPKAVDFRSGKEFPPIYDYSLCIRCYCCQELCPEKAIDVYTPPLGRLIHR